MKTGHTDKFSGGIKKKAVAAICGSVILIVSIGIGTRYALGSALMMETIGSQYEETAALLGEHISSEIAGEVKDVATYATRRLWIGAIKEANAKYKDENRASLEKYFSEMDREWGAADENDPLIRERLTALISASMRDIINIRKGIVELFITDKFGGLVDTSGKTTDFYQADEKWWQNAYNNGVGAIYVSDVEYDGSSKKWVISIAVPVKDENGAVIGICKNSVAIDRLFRSITGFRIGDTGHAAIVDDKGRIVFHKGTAPMSAIDCVSKNEILRAAKNNKRYGTLRNSNTGFKNIFYAFMPLKTPYGLNMMIVINQDADETLKPLNDFILQLFAITILMIILTIPVGILLGEFFSRPIDRLNTAAARVIGGDWNYPIKLTTGDEIERFAITFQQMVNMLKKKQEELLSSNARLKSFSENLEEKVEERTAELNRTQEATLNILEDLSETKVNLEKEAKALEEAIKIKSNFTSTISHELRTPLAAIKEGISLVSDGTTGAVQPEQKEFLDMAKRNVDRLARLIDNILDFQKLEAGKMAFDIKENDINEVAREAVATMAPLAQEKDINLALELEDALPAIRFDRDRIEQVLINLLSNALKFTEKGSVTVTTEKGDNVIRVSVSDTGIGIKETDIPKLFTQFEQVNDGIDRKTGGTGLGLAISKELIDNHKGKIWAESEFGKGTTLIFLLPIKERRVAYAKENTDRR